ncbi:unnamed protein product [Didymodactylos carnosus]|uniref:Uncharacterized protein n=1 Tax=Didymodactylos carnosus TaxID=1234261 RepID=A0A8S2SP17_9BILA|nr:unnamed protein product [Didymodactylos carnosus]CAF4243806.1 unnamed protein product [Didymodactylos carnosus]
MSTYNNVLGNYISRSADDLSDLDDANLDDDEGSEPEPENGSGAGDRRNNVIRDFRTQLVETIKNETDEHQERVSGSDSYRSTSQTSTDKSVNRLQPHSKVVDVRPKHQTLGDFELATVM